MGKQPTAVHGLEGPSLVLSNEEGKAKLDSKTSLDSKSGRSRLDSNSASQLSSSSSLGVSSPSMKGGATSSFKSELSSSMFNRVWLVEVVQGGSSNQDALAMAIAEASKEGSDVAIKLCHIMTSVPCALGAELAVSQADKRVAQRHELHVFQSVVQPQIQYAHSKKVPVTYLPVRNDKREEGIIHIAHKVQAERFYVGASKGSTRLLDALELTMPGGCTLVAVKGSKKVREVKVAEVEFVGEANPDYSRCLTEHSSSSQSSSSARSSTVSSTPRKEKGWGLRFSLSLSNDKRSLLSPCPSPTSLTPLAHSSSEGPPPASPSSSTQSARKTKSLSRRHEPVRITQAELSTGTPMAHLQLTRTEEHPEEGGRRDSEALGGVPGMSQPLSVLSQNRQRGSELLSPEGMNSLSSSTRDSPASTDSEHHHSGPVLKSPFGAFSRLLSRKHSLPEEPPALVSSHSSLQSPALFSKSHSALGASPSPALASKSHSNLEGSPSPAWDRGIPGMEGSPGYNGSGLQGSPGYIGRGSSRLGSSRLEAIGSPGYGGNSSSTLYECSPSQQQQRGHSTDTLPVSGIDGRMSGGNVGGVGRQEGSASSPALSRGSMPGVCQVTTEGTPVNWEGRREGETQGKSGALWSEGWSGESEPTGSFSSSSLGRESTSISRGQTMGMQERRGELEGSGSNVTTQRCGTSRTSHFDQGPPGLTRTTSSTSEYHSKGKDPEQTGSFVERAADVGGATSFSFMQIFAATNSLSPQNCLGSIPVGSLYNGRIDNCQVAVMQLTQWDWKAPPSFHSVVCQLFSFDHPCVAFLVGCCAESRTVVYGHLNGKGTLAQRLEGAKGAGGANCAKGASDPAEGSSTLDSNSTLDSIAEEGCHPSSLGYDQVLHDNAKGNKAGLTKYKEDSSLSFHQRLAILSQVAEGLSFLHTLSPPRHTAGTLSPGLVLLDQEDNAQVCLGGVHELAENEGELEKWLSQHEGMRGASGDLTGVDPRKLDSFAFGVLVVQLMTGTVGREEALEILRSCERGEMPSKDLGSGEAGRRASAAELLAKEICNHAFAPGGVVPIPDALLHVARLALLCTDPIPECRPAMQDARALLKRVMAVK